MESLVPVKVSQEQKIKLLLKGTFRELPEADIAFLRGQRNYTEVVLINGEHHLMARTLKSFTDVLSDGFVRIHKSIVVQRALIASIQPGNPPHVLLTDGTQLDAAKARLKAWEAMYKSLFITTLSILWLGCSQAEHSEVPASVRAVFRSASRI